MSTEMRTRPAPANSGRVTVEQSTTSEQSTIFDPSTGPIAAPHRAAVGPAPSSALLPLVVAVAGAVVLSAALAPLTGVEAARVVTAALVALGAAVSCYCLPGLRRSLSREW